MRKSPGWWRARQPSSLVSGGTRYNKYNKTGTQMPSVAARALRGASEGMHVRTSEQIGGGLGPA